MNPLEPHDTFNIYSGEVLRLAVNIESYLEQFISDYFIRPQNDRSRTFEDLILIKMNFDRKIHLFKEICKLEEINDDILKNVLKDINFIKGIRNKVAHFETTYEQLSDDPNDAKIILWNKKSYRERNKDSLDLTDKLMREIKERQFSALQGIVEIKKELHERDISDSVNNKNWKTI